MLKKKFRLSVFGKPSSSLNFDSSLLKIKAFPNEGENTRFGFVVSKKIDGRAVVRNKTKRILQNSVKKFLNTLSGSKNVIIVAKKKIDKENKTEIENILEQGFSKTKVIK